MLSAECLERLVSLTTWMEGKGEADDGMYSRYKVVYTCKVSLTLATPVNLVAVEVRKILETLDIVNQGIVITGIVKTSRSQIGPFHIPFRLRQRRFTAKLELSDVNSTNGDKTERNRELEDDRGGCWMGKSMWSK